MSNIEDKILDGPRVHYCDDGNDDIRLENSNNDGSDCPRYVEKASSIFVRPDEASEELNRISQRIPGCSTNTGPKGVIEDHKQSLCRKPNKSTDEADFEAEFQELLNDDTILKEYISKRMSFQHVKDLPTFGQVYRLQSGTELLKAIDNEKANVLVVVHIYTKYSRTCKNVDKCLDELALELKHIKFLTLDASVAGLSSNFKENGVPALLAYKSGNLIKSLVQLEEFLDRDFNTVQIKELLVDNGLID